MLFTFYIFFGKQKFVIDMIIFYLRFNGRVLKNRNFFE